ncbi:MAG: LysR family transcriptional regulator, partial [Candidatus Thioglobus sp.]|uniref:LysR family transcriptional regulator n=1 Tax=Candidatus Thioglobus sp. TaxID=2026721 RepID=UPI002629E6B8
QALYKQGNVSDAADSLFLTQSALSHQIKKLENLIDGSIFVRHSDPFKLTPQGQKLLALASDVLPRIEITEKQLIHSEGGRLNIAIECHSCFDWLIPTLDVFREKQPKVDFDLSLAFSFEPMEALKNYDVDMVVTSDPLDDKQFEYFPLFDYQMLMVMSLDSPLTKKPYLTPGDIKDQTLLTYPVSHDRLDVFNYFLKPAKVNPKTTRKVELPLMMMQLMLNNQGIATMPQWALTDDQKSKVALKSLGKNGIWRTLYLAVRRVDKKLGYIKEFADIAKHVSSKNLNDIKVK